MEATKELERTIEDINLPNQVFFSKSSKSYSYNLRFKSGPVVIPRSGTQRHANSFKVRDARLLNCIIGISRTSLPTLEQRRMEATKRELERTIEDINHPNQVFFSKSSRSYSYNLRFKSDPVVIPRFGTQRHTNSFKVRAARLLNCII